MKRIIIIVLLLPILGVAQLSEFHSNNDLTEEYTQAITDFIKAVKEQHHKGFDTLYFGKHIYGQPDDFPDIELPRTIENTQIRLTSPENGLKIQKANKLLVYINMIGWVDKEQMEFIFVVFSNGGEHQYDCFINYNYDEKLRSFRIEKKRFEYYLYKNKPG
jgi:hypothetical protein